MGRHYRLSVFVALIAFIIGFGAMGAQPASAKGAGAPPVSFARLDFTAGSAGGVTVTATSLTLALGATTGSWTSASQSAGFPFDELVASWNATTPSGSWITIEMQASGSARTTKWYTMGIWTSDADPAHRTSLGGQADVDGTVAIDTFIRAKKASVKSG